MPIVCLVFNLKYKVKLEYLGNRPARGKHYLIVSNHRSMNDPPIIASYLNMPMAFIAKKELFSNPLFAFLISLYSAILIDRENTKKSTFDLTKTALKTKRFGGAWNSSIFIEGTRSKDPQSLGMPNNGAIFIARVNKVPILPIGITYTDKNEIIIKVGEAYEVDRKQELDDAAWDCLDRISNLCDYKLPNRSSSSSPGL
jgi:1-acyl-sn-glycerol-3-phosphate acyltransferase